MKKTKLYDAALYYYNMLDERKIHFEVLKKYPLNEGVDFYSESYLRKAKKAFKDEQYYTIKEIKATIKYCDELIDILCFLLDQKENITTEQKGLAACLLWTIRLQIYKHKRHFKEENFTTLNRIKEYLDNLKQYCKSVNELSDKVEKQEFNAR